MVFPEPVENPRSVLQRWIDAGRTPVAVYALLIPNAEFRAFKRAVEVQVRGSGARARKKTRADERREEEAPLLEPDEARTLLEDLQRVDVGSNNVAACHFLPEPSKVNSAVRCFQFGMILPPPLVQIHPLSVV